MRINLKILLPTLFLLLVFHTGVSLSDEHERVGKVVRADKTSRIKPKGQAETDFTIIQGTESRDLFVDGMLRAQRSEQGIDGFVQLHLDDERSPLDDDRNTLVILRDGSIEVKRDAKELICHVTGRVLFLGKYVKKSKPPSCNVLADEAFIRHNNTKFLIDARGMETSIFVMEGSVKVSSIDPRFTETQEVVAGEWLVTRRGYPIPPPQRYRRTDAGSGSSVCLYSWCRITRNVLTDGPERSLRALIPPPPNPPGQR